MPFRSLTDKTRDQPLGHATPNALLENQLSTQALAAYSHTQDGLHNVLQVARAVGLITYSAGSYSVDGVSSAFISSVSSGATGTVTLTLAANKFSTPMVVKVTPLVSTLPVLVTHEVVSATSIKVYLKTIGSLAENTWSAVNTSFVIAIHSAPYTTGGSAPTFGTTFNRRNTLAASKWNTLIAAQAQQQANLLAEHTAAGAHNIVETAYGYGQFQLDSGGTSYTKLFGENTTSITRTSAGVLTVNISAARYATPLLPFLSIGYKSQASGSTADIYLAGYVTGATSTTLPIKFWKWDSGGNTWAATDADFAVTIHTAPA